MNAKGRDQEDRLATTWSWVKRSLATQPAFSSVSLAWMAVALGVGLRVWEYLEFRQLYMDEESLLLNIVGRPVFEFDRVLENDQMAPPAFLAVERLLVLLPLSVKASARLFPLFCGVVSMPLLLAVSRRFLAPGAVPFAVAAMALGDHLIYYSAEIKQYSCDLALALAALWLAAPDPPHRWGGRPLGLALFGLVAPWFSFTVVFVLAAVGLHWIVTAGRSGESGWNWRGSALAAAVCGFWLASFAACFALARSILSPRDFIWIWWNFAFLPIPPRTWAEVSLLGETLANVFINPIGLITPLGMPGTAVLAVVLAVVGGFALGWRSPGVLFLIVAPLGFALAASALRQYPFHGRLLLFLVPTYLLPLGEGVATVGAAFGSGAVGRWVTLALGAFILSGQAGEIAWHKAIQGRARTFDSHGDLKNDLLDYLEATRARAARESASSRLPGDPKP